MSVGAILTLGLGGYSDVNHVVTLGYIPGAAQTTPPPPVASGGAGGLITFLAWKAPTEAQIEKTRLELLLRKKKLKLKKVEKKIHAAEVRVFKAPEPPQGVLANLGALREEAYELRRDIEVMAVDLQAVRDFLLSLKFDDDEEDLEVLLLGL